MSEKTRRLLVPVGFSEQSLRALDQALIVAKSIGAEVSVISVIESNSFWEKLTNKERDLDQLKDETLVSLKEIIDQREHMGVHIEPIVARGAVHEEIARAVDMLAPEIVVMGSNGRPHNFGKKFLGSNAFRVMKQVKEPIIIMQGERGFSEVKKIAFPVMLDKKSKEKVGECLHWARIWNAEVNIVAVAHSEKERLKLRPHVVQVHEYINKHGVKASFEIIDAENRTTPKAVLEYCDQVGSDLLMIMDDDDDTLARIGGNEVESVLYNAEIPVMCVTPRPAKYGTGFQAI